MTTAPVRDHLGSIVFASDGAVAQQGPRPVRSCGTCGSEVVWLLSRRTGRRYLADVFHGASGARYYVGRATHSCCSALDAIETERLSVEWRETSKRYRRATAAGDHAAAAEHAANLDRLDAALTEVESRA